MIQKICPIPNADLHTGPSEHTACLFVISRKREFFHVAKVMAKIIADLNVQFQGVKLAVRNDEMVTAREVLLAT